MDSDFFNPPLTERLKQILEKYPDGGQILKVDSDFLKIKLKSTGEKTRVQLLSSGEASECRGRWGFRGAVLTGLPKLLQRENYGTRHWQE